MMKIKQDLAMRDAQGDILATLDCNCNLPIVYMGKIDGNYQLLNESQRDKRRNIEVFRRFSGVNVQV